MTRRILLISVLLVAITFPVLRADALTATKTYATGITNWCSAAFLPCSSFNSFSPWLASDPRGIPVIIGIVAGPVPGTCAGPYWIDAVTQYAGQVDFFVTVGENPKTPTKICNQSQWRLSYLGQNGGWSVFRSGGNQVIRIVLKSTITGPCGVKASKARGQLKPQQLLNLEHKFAPKCKGLWKVNGEVRTDDSAASLLATDYGEITVT